MPTTSSARHFRPRRPLAWSLVAAVVALTSVLGASSSVSASESEWPMTLVTSGTTAPVGSTVTFTLHITPTRSAGALADIEVFDAKGGKAFQFFWDAQLFSIGRSKSLTTTWEIPADQQPGKYFIKTGVFRIGWGELYAWNDDAGTLTITEPGAPSSTAPTTTAATPTTISATTIAAPTTAATSTTVRPTTTTAVPTTAAPTTTARPTTTTAVPTTAAPTTTVRPTTTQGPSVTAPPTALMFNEDFSTEAGFSSRFDIGWSGQDPATMPDYAGPIREWLGDHDGACGAPTTTRTIHVANKAEVFWWCAPGGDAAKGHLMTGVNTVGYNIAWFSPKQWFTNVTRVCWDQNLTDLGGGKWTQVVLVSEGEYNAYDGDLGFTGPGFQVNGAPTTGINPTDLSLNSGVGGAKMMLGSFQVWRGGDFTGGLDWWAIAGGRGPGTAGFADKAARFQHCMVDNENGTITLSQARPGGSVHTQTVRGDLPDGRVRVVFQDDNYDPDKHGGTSTAGDPRYTWHWDNIQIG